MIQYNLINTNDAKLYTKIMLQKHWTLHLYVSPLSYAAHLLFAQESGHLRGRDLGCDFCLGAEPTYCCLGLLVSKIFTKTKWRERGTEWKSRIQLNQQPEPEVIQIGVFFQDQTSKARWLSLNLVWWCFLLKWSKLFNCVALSSATYILWSLHDTEVFHSPTL